MKKLFVIMLVITLALQPSVSVRCASASPSAPSVSAQSAVLMDFDSGEVLFAHNSNERMGMASTTKIMTALTVLRILDSDLVLTVPAEAVGTEGSSVYLCEGERMTVRQMLYALLLASANDAAVTLALCACGSIEEFAKQMNLYARELGLADTNFTNPHGLYDKEHYTTSYDLAVISREAMKHPLLGEIFSTYKATIPFDGQEDARLVVNHNRLLRTYDGAIGVKTGFTKATGRCLVSAAKRDGMTLICVTLNAPDDWRDHKLMLDFGFSAFSRVVVADVGEFSFLMPLTGGYSDCVRLTNALPLVLTLPKGMDNKEVYTVSSTSRFIFAPVHKGYTCAQVTVSVQGQSASSPLSAADTLLRKEYKKSLFQWLFNKD